jgi:hypothetical protein
VPARPRERRIAIHILRVNFGAGVQEKLDRILAREGSGAMKGVSFLVRQSRMKAPVSTEGFVMRFGSAPPSNKTLTTKR